MTAIPKIYDALIFGGGPAGLSAAMALARVCRTSIVFDSGEYRNQGSQAMHTFLSRDGVHPEGFRATARQNIQATYSAQVSFMKSRIVQISNKEILPGYKGFEAADEAGQTYLGRKLILATGTEDLLPTDVEGYRENWPEHIHQCPFCDGYEHQSTPVGLLTFPNPSYAHLALIVRNFNKANTTIYSNGPIPSDDATQTALQKVLAIGVKLDERRVRRLVNNGEGSANGITLEFETGPAVKLGMLFHRPPTRSRALELIGQLGLEMTAAGEVQADAMTLQSSVKGCFVAGDIHEPMKQAVMAAAHGVRAAGMATMQLCEEEGIRALEAVEKQGMDV
ncbi:thioredoxin reductase [Chaetomidium leptoderma]|uniref:Thioredoxin reductase n=1 Tax=Chaetomidium leptoderma TaxID=669021 RepID=A0AAN6ZTN6_9PEZI|nr:thioredoxin reductase [Chaetomidium leptoderma]